MSFQAPYTLKGENSDGLIPWYPTETGLYYLSVYSYKTENLNESPEDTYFATFYVDNIAGENTTQENQFNMYPNPIHQQDLHLHLEQNVDKNTQLIIRDKQGNIKLTQSVQSQDIDINTKGLEPGVYFVEVQTSTEILRKLLIVN